MNTNALQRKLNLLADEFDKAAERFPDQPCLLYLPSERNGIQGPRIPRQEKYQPNMIREVWGRFEDGYWRFKELAKRLYPLLQQAGAELVTNEGSTPDGSVMFWALGNEYPPPARIAVLPNSNPFWHVSLAVRELLIEMEVKPTEPEKSEANGDTIDLNQVLAAGDDNLIKILAIAGNQDLSVSEKVGAIYRIDQSWKGKESADIADLLKCSGSAVRRCSAWKTRHRE